MSANTPASRKQKGRSHQQYIARRIKETFNLADSDVQSTSMGASGLDVKLSQAAREKFPFAIEAKRVEKLNFWAAWEQAVANTEEGLHPMVVVKRNHSPVLAVIEFSVLLELQRRANA